MCAVERLFDFFPLEVRKLGSPGDDIVNRNKQTAQWLMPSQGTDRHVVDFSDDVAGTDDQVYTSKKSTCSWVKIENKVSTNMAVESDPDVLDLLFDKSAGILKSELPDIQTLDFVSYHVIHLTVTSC